MVTAPDIDATRRHFKTETWLDELGVPWKFEPALPLAIIDRQGSLANQARLEPLDEAVVDRYAADYERGDVFPPIIVYQPGRHGSVVLIGGNHRIEGATRARRTHHSAYIVDPAPDQVLPLTYGDNRRHGLPPSDDERVLHASHLIAARGISQAEAAAVVGLSLGKLNRGLATLRADARASDLGIEAWPTLVRSVRWRLSSIESDPVFEAAARLAIFTDMGADATYTLVRQLVTAKDDTEALVMIREAEEEQAARRRYNGPRSAKASSRSRMLEALRVVGSLDPDLVLAGCTTVDHRRVLRDTIFGAARVMSNVEARLAVSEEGIG